LKLILALFLAVLPLIGGAAGASTGTSAINPGLVQGAPVPSTCAAGKHWTLLGSGIAHCVLDDPVCSGATPDLVHDALGNPSCKAPVITTEYRTKSCPAGYSGSIDQERTVTTHANGTVQYGSWKTTYNDCTADAPPPPPPTPTCSNGASDYPTCTPPSSPAPTCSNGATNYPTCTLSGSPTCSNGAADYPTCTPPTCTNGATNYPSCNAFPSCPNGATNYPACTLFPSPPPPAVTCPHDYYSCSPWKPEYWKMYRNSFGPAPGCASSSFYLGLVTPDWPECGNEI